MFRGSGSRKGSDLRDFRCVGRNLAGQSLRVQVPNYHILSKIVTA